MKRLDSKSITCLGVIISGLSSTLSAQTFTDQTSDENWNNPLNWSSGALPGSSTGQTAYIIDGQAALLTTSAASVPNAFNVTVGNASAGGSVYLSQDMPTLATLRVANSNNGAIGEWTQTAGDVNASSLKVGGTGGGSGIVYLAGGSMSLTGNIDVFDSGSINIQGDGVALTANNMTLSGTSSVELLVDSGGTNPVDLSGALTIDPSSAQLGIDCGFYQGGSTTIELMKFQSISGSFASNNIILQGLEGTYSGSIVTDSDSINVVITASPTATTYYKNTTQDDLWNTAGNWSTASVPGATSKVILNNGRTAIVDQNLSGVVDTVMVGNNAFTNTLLQLEADFAVNKMMIGFNSKGIGKVQQLGGDVVVNRIFQIASTTTTGDNSGSYTISGGTLAFPYAELTVGTVGPASFRVEGSQATDIRGADLKLGSDGSLEFILDQAGVTGIRIDGSFEFETGSTMTVDGTDYKGTDGYFPLIRGGNLVGSFDPAMVNLIGFTGRNAQVIVDDGLWIRLMEGPLLSTFRGHLTGLFPASSVAAATANNAVSVFRGYSASGSLWSQSFSEAHVMSLKLSNNNTGVGGADLSWDLRIGRGGQIYSFRNDSMGELVPPQSYSNSPWIDSVWQGVAVDSYLNQTVDDYFIHQAGMYVSDSDFTEEPFYSPMVAANSNTGGRYLSTVNWGSHAHAGIFTDATTVNDFQSSLLYYNRYKDLGDGVIEVTLGIYNYGEDTMQHLNMPFGGIRRSTLNYAFLSNPDGTWVPNTAGGFFDNADTGGWVAYSDTPTTGASPSLGVVYGYGDTPFAPGSENLAAYIRSNYYTNGSTPKVDDTAWRNGHMFTNIRKFNLSQGQGAWCRYYFVFSDTVAAVKSKIDARGLVASAELTAFDFTESSSPLLGYSVSGSAGAYELVETSTAPQFSLYAHPVSGSFPIYEIVEKGSAPYLSASPYTTGIVKTYDGTIAGIRLLGFALKTADINSGGTSYTYSSLQSVLSSYSDYYRSAGEALSVRIP